MPIRPALHVVTVGNPASRRVSLFQSALERLGQPPSTIISYLDLIAGRVRLEDVLRAGSVLRIESPGQDFEVEKALLAEGADVDDQGGPTRIDRRQAAELPFDRGRIWFPRQWFLGFRKVLHLIEQQRLACPEHVAMNVPADIEVMFDKPRCQTRLTEFGIPCPRSIGPVQSYDELRARMRETGVSRVFVKLAHGSSASGVVAFAVGPRSILAITTAEVVREGGEIRLYNSRILRRIENEREVAELINALAREGVQVEQWLPKAGLDGHVFDLRVVVIAGDPGHVVVRMSRSPLTNLHLKNRRGDPALLRSRMAEDAWEAAMTTAQRAASTFPETLHAGVDLLIAPGYRRHAILEVNAFGDLLNGVENQGLDTYATQVQALLGGWAA